MPAIKVDAFAAECAGARADNARDAFNWAFGQMQKRCESPIEEIMLAALLVELHDVGSPFLLWNWAFQDFSWPGDPVVPTDNVTLFCQATVGEYRADFLLGIWSLGRRRAIVIECDGHDFHERTKAQARRDRQRDRWMTLNDVVVLRFTGSEIHADPLVCAVQVADQFEKTYFSMGAD